MLTTSYYKTNLRRLRLMTDAHDRPFEIVTLPMPGVVGGRAPTLAISIVYRRVIANFYIANAVVFGAIFGHANDALALKTIEGLFPDRRVVASIANP